MKIKWLPLINSLLFTLILTACGGGGSSDKDADNDGVNNSADTCPDTSAGANVDENGCSDEQKDSDSDKVNDALDQCPDTTAGATVDENGCADAQKDSDADGVNDSLDTCPNTAANSEVDNNGCADVQKDTDSDGVNDALDACPTTPAGSPVDANGCADSEKDTDSDGVTDDKDMCGTTPPESTVDDTGCTEQQRKFVNRAGSKLTFNGKEFRFQGSNNYYMHYRSNAMIDDVLQDSVEMNVDVLRIWGFLDGINPNEHGFEMQPELGVFTPSENMGSGWERLDYTVQKAGELGIKLVIAFTNNWSDFGGVPQYMEWLGLDSHEEFFTDPAAKAAYKAFVNELVNRVNTYTGVAYKDDPTIMTWELMNEPRVESDNTKKVLVNWADEMSTYVKSLDANHLVALGSEGFFNRDHSLWAYNGHSGVDWEAIIALDNIDYGTIHLYPEHWDLKDQVEEWGTQWILDHIDAGKAIGKPVVLEEYGTLADGNENRAFIYERWTNAIYDNGAAGSMFWLLTGIDDGENADEEGLYGDFDKFRILNDDSPASSVLRLHGALMAGEEGTRSPKVYIASPIDGEVSGELTVEAYPFTYGGNLSSITLSTSSGYTTNMTDADNDGYYTANWNTETEEENAEITLTVTIKIGDETYTDTKAVSIQNSQVWVLDKEFLFDANAEGWDRDPAAEAEWQSSFGDPAVEWSDALGDGAIAVNSIYPGAENWEELRIKAPAVPNIGTYSRITYDIYIPENAYNSTSGKPQVARPYIVLTSTGDDAKWVTIGQNEITGAINEFELVSLNGANYYHIEMDLEWEADNEQTVLMLGNVFNELEYTGKIYIDNIKLYKEE